MISSRYAQSKKKRKIIFSRKKLMQGGQLVPVNILQTYIYVNLNVRGSTVSVNNITNQLVQSVATNTPGSVILSIDPSLSTLADYTLFGYNSGTAAWTEIPRTNLDAGGSSVALYGNVPGMLIRKQTGATDQHASMEISIPVPATTYGNVMQFVNITDSVFGFTATNNPITATNVYIQLIFTASYSTTGTKTSGWLPKSVPSLSLWLNASEPGTGTFTPNTGIKMTNWTDKSGNNNHAAASATSAPLYQNLPGGVGMGMYFNGSTYFSGNIQGSGNYSYTFAVVRPTTTGGRVLSLAARDADDSTSNKYMGVSASGSGNPTPPNLTIIMGVSLAPNSILYSQDAGITWTPSVGGWNGSCQNIAYNGTLFVATGNDGVNGVIYNSKDGINWTQVHPAPGQLKYFFYVDQNSKRGGIPALLYTGSMWICGGQSSESYTAGYAIPAMAYSYDGTTWILNTTKLPFSAGSTDGQPFSDCIRNIATDGNIFILSGYLDPSMAYSYDGINWSLYPMSVYATLKVPSGPRYSGAHAVNYHPDFKLWLAVGDGGNPTTTPGSDLNNKMASSMDGLNWIPTIIGSTKNPPISFYTNNSLVVNYTRIIITKSINNIPTWYITGPVITGPGAQASSLVSTADTSYSSGILFRNTACPTQSNGATIEVSAVYTYNTLTTIMGYIVGNTLTVVSMISGNLNNSGGSRGPWNELMSFNQYTLDTPLGGTIYQWTGGTNGGVGTYNIDISQYVGSADSPVKMNLRSLVVFYGLQQQLNGYGTYYGGPGVNSYLIRNYFSGGGGNGWYSNASVNYPVNVIIDNTNPKPNFTAKMFLNNNIVTAGQLDIATNKPAIVSSWSDGTNECLTINGTIIPSTLPVNARFNISSYAIGKNLGNSTNNYSGYMYEILNYNGKMYSVARRTIEGYLAWKWSIQSLLPASHPFYKRAPSVNSATIPWPKIFPDLQPVLWLDAQDPNGNDAFAPKDRTLISTWYDKSGNANHLTAPNGAEPMFRTNVVPSGAVHFNRYAYQSMSLQMLPSMANDIAVPATGLGGPNTWMPGFGGFNYGASTGSTVADPYGFIYIASVKGNIACIYQFDEVNVQTRLFYYIYNTNLANCNINGIVGMQFGPITGNLYAAISVQGGPASVTTTLFFVFIPNSLPITPSTTYSVVRPTMNKADGTPLSGWGMFTMDSNETMYLWPNTSGPGNNTCDFYRFPLANYTSSKWTSDFNYNVNTMGAKWLLYSAPDNAISFAFQSYVRLVVYLSTCATFTGSISATVLTVSAMSAGTLAIGSQFIYNTTLCTIISMGTGMGTIGTYNLTYQDLTASPPNYANTVPPYQQNPPTLFTTCSIQMGNSSFYGSTANNIAAPVDGLYNVSVTNDTTANGCGNGNNYTGNTFYNNDSYANYAFVSDTITISGATNSPYGCGPKIRRINLKTRLTTTISGVVNLMSVNKTTTVHTLANERFPVTFEANGVYETPYPTYAGQYETGSGYSGLPTLIGKTSAYSPTVMNSNGRILGCIKISNPRATSSCMSGPLAVSSPAISFFIVYINTNLSKNVMPHSGNFLTPMISMSTAKPHVSFIGSIVGTKLTVTAMVSPYTAGSTNPIQTGATLNTSLGGFIFQYGTATTTNPIGTYTVSIQQIVPAGTTISATNGIDRTNNSNAGPSTVTAGNGAALGVDATSSSFVSVYTNSTNINVYHGATNTQIPSTAAAPNWPVSGLPNTCTGYIVGTTFTVVSVTSGVISNGYSLNTAAGGVINYFMSGVSSNPTNNTGVTPSGGPGNYNISVNQTVGSASNLVNFTLTSATILPDMLFYSSKSGWTGSKLNGGDISVTNTNTYPSNIDISDIGLGLQPNNTPFKESLIPNYFFDGSICEVMIYNKDLSTEKYKIAAMEGYLAWKWGIQSKLPATHMYKYAQPLDFVTATPSPITSTVYKNLTDTGFTLYWSGGIGGTVFSYAVKQGDSIVASATVVDNGATGNNIIVGGLVYNTGYTVTITPYSTLAQGTAYTTPTITTQNWPSPITDIKITHNPSSFFNTEFKVSWKGGIVSASYVYSFSPGPPAGYTIADNGISSQNIVVSGMAHNTQYTLTITATAPGGHQVSASSTFTTKGWVIEPYLGGSMIPAGLPVTQIPAPGDGVGAAAQFTYAKSLAIDSADNIYFYDSAGVGRVRVATPTGIVYTIPVSLGYDRSTSTINFNYALAVDKSGNIFVFNAMGGNIVIQKLTPSNFPLTIGANNTVTTTWTLSIFLGPSGSTPAPTIPLTWATGNIMTNAWGGIGFAFDNSGNLYFRYTQDQVMKIAIPGNTTSIIKPQSPYYFQAISQITFDASNNMYVSCASIAGGQGNMIAVVAPNGTSSQIGSGGCCNSGDGTYTTGQLYLPAAMAVNKKNGLLLVYDQNTGKIKMVANGQIVSINGWGNNIIPTMQGLPYYMPQGIVVDSNGIFYLGWQQGIFKVYLV